MAQTQDTHTVAQEVDIRGLFMTMKVKKLEVLLLTLTDQN